MRTASSAHLYHGPALLKDGPNVTVELSQTATHSPLAQTRTHVTPPNRPGAVELGTLSGRTWIMSRIWGSLPVRSVLLRLRIRARLPPPTYHFLFAMFHCFTARALHTLLLFCHRNTLFCVYHLHMPVMTVMLVVAYPFRPSGSLSFPCRASRSSINYAT